MLIIKILFPIVLICLVFSSCKQNKKNKITISEKPIWTENQIKKYFADNIAYGLYNGRYSGQKDSLSDFEIFSRNILDNVKAKNINDPLILALDEPYIDTTKIDSTKSWIRFTVNPCFRKPYCLIVEKKFNKTFITAKLTDGNGGYYSGLLFFSITNILSDSVFNDLSSKFKKIDFWHLGEDTTCSGGFDGETWTVEAIEVGKYNLIKRWAPFHCGNEITKQIAQIGYEIRTISYMFEGLKIKYKKTTKKEFDNIYGK